MSVMDEIQQEEVWQAFFAYRTGQERLRREEAESLSAFIAEKRYRKYTDASCFGYPEKILVAKRGSDKKRTVYSYDPDETWVLKLIAWLLYRYDDKLGEACCSFRSTVTARDALMKILRIGDLDSLYAVRADIHDYFNSIDISLLVPVLRRIISDDPRLCLFLETLLKQDRCIYEGECIGEKRGVMAGVPFAPFLADIFLLSLDSLFTCRQIPYFRYSDDILFFAHDEAQAEEGLRMIEEHLADVHLQINPDKTEIVPPHQPWTFLGIAYHDGKYGLSDVTVGKVKAKIRRKARALYRQRRRKGLTFEQTAVRMIRWFDRKFYSIGSQGTFSWVRWYFPLITDTEGLRRIDEAMVQWLRYLSAGRHTKANYRIAYDDLKKLGYTSMVNEYYTWVRENRKLAGQ